MAEEIMSDVDVVSIPESSRSLSSKLLNATNNTMAASTDMEYTCSTSGPNHSSSVEASSVDAAEDEGDNNSSVDSSAVVDLSFSGHMSSRSGQWHRSSGPDCRDEGMDEEADDEEENEDDIQVIATLIKTNSAGDNSRVNSGSSSMRPMSGSARQSHSNQLSVSFGLYNSCSDGSTQNTSNVLKSSSAEIIVSTVNSAIYSNLMTTPSPKSLSPSQALPPPPPPPNPASVPPSGAAHRQLHLMQSSSQLLSQPSSCGKLFSHLSAADTAPHQSGYTLLRSASGPSGKTAVTAGCGLFAEKSYSAIASSEVKNTLQRHILSKRLSANAALSGTTAPAAKQHSGGGGSNATASKCASGASSFLMSPPNGNASCSSPFLQLPQTGSNSPFIMDGCSNGNVISRHLHPHSHSHPHRHNQNQNQNPNQPRSAHMDSLLDHADMLYSAKRSLTLSNSYGATSHNPVPVKQEVAKEPLRKTYSEPNLKMARNKLKMPATNNEETLSELDQLMPVDVDHRPAGGVSPSQTQTGVAHHHSLHHHHHQQQQSHLQHHLNTLSSSNAQNKFSPQEALLVFQQNMYNSLHSSAAKRSSGGDMLPLHALAHPHKPKAMLSNPLYPQNMQDFGHRNMNAASSKLPPSQNALAAQLSFGNSSLANNYHSPLRVRLSDENSSCGSMSPHLFESNNSNLDNRPSGTTSVASEGSMRPMLSQSSQGISKSSSFHGTILDPKGFRGPLRASPPNNSQNSAVATAAALSAIMSAAGVTPLSQAPSFPPPMGASGRTFHNFSAPQFQRVLDKSSSVVTSTQSDAISIAAMSAAAAAASAKLLNQPQHQLFQQPSTATAAADILAQMRSSSDHSVPVDHAFGALTAHLQQQQQQQYLFRHLSDSSLQPSSFQQNANAESKSHPPLRRIIGPGVTPNNLPVPPMPALLSFAANTGSRHAQQQQQQSSSSDSAAGVQQQQQSEHHQSSQSQPQNPLAAGALGNPGEQQQATYNQLFNFYYRQYSAAALLNADAAAAATSLLMPAALTPPTVLLEPPPPTPQFAEMQLSNHEKSTPPSFDFSNFSTSSSTSPQDTSPSQLTKGQGKQALQAKLQRKKSKRGQSSSHMNSDKYSSDGGAAMDFSSAVSRDLAENGSSPLSEDADSAEVLAGLTVEKLVNQYSVRDSSISPSTTPVNVSLPATDESSNANSLAQSSSDEHASSLTASNESCHSGGFSDDGRQRGTHGVVLKKHQIFMMHSLQNSSIGLGGDERISLNVENYNSARLVRKRTGLGYNPVVLNHFCHCNNVDMHIESPLRVQYVWIKLLELDIPKHCKVSLGREVLPDELELVHSSKYVQAFSGSNAETVEELKSQLSALSCGGKGIDTDLVWNVNTSPQACLGAVGVVVELAEKVARSELSNAFALVRPPGQHAENSQPLGFSFFNNVAITAKTLLAKSLAKRVAIIDWDVHHGIGTEKVFEDDPNVLYISVHRYDNGSFFPGTGSPSSVGSGSAKGRTVNVGFSSSGDVPMADEDYMAAFRSVVVPLSRHFNPNIVLVSAGFDASRGHDRKLGGYIVSPECFGWMTKQVLSVAQGKAVLCLEDGFDFKTLTDSVVSCMYQLIRASTIAPTAGASPASDSDVYRALSGYNEHSSFMQRLLHPPLVKKTSLDALPSPEAIQSIEATLAAQEPFWPSNLIKFARDQLHISQSQADSLSQSQDSQMEALNLDSESDSINKVCGNGSGGAGVESESGSGGGGGGQSPFLQWQNLNMGLMRTGAAAVHQEQRQQTAIAVTPEQQHCFAASERTDIPMEQN